MKRIIIILCTIFLFILIGLSIWHFTHPSYITADEAKQIAIDDVANKDNKYTFNTIEFTETNNTYIYTLEFNDKINIYKYKINAKTKKIISYKKELINNNKTYMKEEDVLKLVFEHSNLNKNECNLLSNLVTIEDGIPIYNIVFYYKNTRYEYKINAYTGSIISVTKLNENAN